VQAQDQGLERGRTDVVERRKRAGGDRPADYGERERVELLTMTSRNRPLLNCRPTVRDASEPDGQRRQPF
jgi:hypothetical protein